MRNSYFAGAGRSCGAFGAPFFIENAKRSRTVAETRRRLRVALAWLHSFGFFLVRHVGLAGKPRIYEGGAKKLSRRALKCTGSREQQLSSEVAGL